MRIGDWMDQIIAFGLSKSRRAAVPLPAGAFESDIGRKGTPISAG